VSAFAVGIHGALGAVVQLGPLALLAVLYARRVHRLGRSGPAVPRWRQASFYAGLARNCWPCTWSSTC
jgi:hypothetical protein